jgi:hypothetical protein
VIDTKNELSKKFKNVKDEDSGVKIDEGFIGVRVLNNTYIVLSNDGV